MEKSFQLQAQIKQNAEELSSYLNDLRKWESKSNKIEENKKSALNLNNRNPIRSSGTIKVQNTRLERKIREPKAPDSHTYDKGYQKWEKFNVDACDDDVSDYVPETIPKEGEQDQLPVNISYHTPATIVKVKNSHTPSLVPRARGVANDKDMELAERERGNKEFSTGNFTLAVKCYTKCLGLKAGNFTAFSNRSMAYLKLKDFHRAEADATCALRLMLVSPTPISPLIQAKALSRRAAARNALGEHRAALRDLISALDLQPTSKELRADIQQTREALRSAVNRAPLVSIPIAWA